MRKTYLGCLLAALCCFGLGGNPASAADSGEIANPVELGVRSLGFLSGVTIGVPISTVRVMPDAISRNVKGVASALSASNSPDETQIIAATIPGVVLGVCDGLTNGVSNGVINAFRQEPFSLGSFSLDE